MNIDIVGFLRNDLFSTLKGLVRLVISLGAINVNVQADRLMTPPEAKVKQFLKELPKPLTPEQEAKVLAKIREGSDCYGDAVAIIAKAQLD